MLEGLCGNKNIQRVLIFLFVNERCYGTQLHRALHTPLTPIQKALLRLEKGGVITSHLEGKTRHYHFNPSYPLLTELELLLKKAYTLLSPQEKKEYYVMKEDRTAGLNNLAAQQKVLFAFWEKLSTVSQLTFSAKSKTKDDLGWNGKGKGDVTIAKENSNTLIFHEKGKWLSQLGNEVCFSNAFRWTLDRHNNVISLEHLRQGPDHPVFLFHLAPASKQSLASVDSHLCAGDTYFGQIHFDRYSLRLNWRVIGPKKNEELSYIYC